MDKKPIIQNFTEIKQIKDTKIIPQDTHQVVHKGVFGWDRLKFYSTLFGGCAVILLIIWLLLSALTSGCSEMGCIAVGLGASAIFILVFISIIVINIILIIIYENTNWKINKKLRFISIIYICIIIAMILSPIILLVLDHAANKRFAESPMRCFSNQDYKDKIFLCIANDAKTIADCELIDDSNFESIKEKCNFNVAVKSKDTKLCDLIIDSSLRSDCIVQIKEN